MKVAPGINLIPREERATRAEIARRRLIFVGSLILLAGYGALVFFLLSSAGYLAYRAQSLSGKIQVAADQLSLLSAKETLVVSLKSRMEGAVLVLERQNNFKDWIETIEVLAPAGVSLAEINLDNAGGLQVSGTAENSSLLSDFVDRLGQAGLPGVVFTTISREEAPAFEFVLEVSVAQKEAG